LISGCSICTYVATTLTCTTPINGYYLDPLYPTQTFTCPYLCSSCTSSTFCTNCFNNIMLVPITGGDCLCNDPNLPYLDSTTKTCINCQNVIYNCANCVSGATLTCTVCDLNYYVSIDQLSCLPCLSTCLTCTNSYSCATCESGYFLSAGLCICDSSCISCGLSYSGCSLCSPTCQDCLAGFYLSAPNTCTACPY
jgi:hypothetical protein